ncbi:MAG: putative fluoride ion transporter CrcB [Proteobacteria bacterium]|nr:MAG: putative fluoride ion transporter CrcB [Pseudomonadota bacterium]
MGYLYVAMGGAFGAVFRYLSMNLIGLSNFPYGTFFVNITGSFLIGMFLSYESGVQSLPQELKLLIVVGFLGAFTTFSTFSMDSIHLIQKSEYFKAIAYVTGSLALSFSAFIIGMQIFKQS